MAQIRVKKGRLSPVASLLMIVLGAITYFLVSHTAGAVLVFLGAAMFLVYDRLTVGQGKPSSPPSSSSSSPSEKAPDG